ncbi:ABC transporter permease [Hyunsoonleella pacifica]|uniref:ABC transporter permease n=1 Tax=Hyunsoonleella pacifica TaxID=1080224 RepID=A0A4Q9FKV6_9FLAO|nr:ABC transporter permease [Hyunsoonleella pacifica]TBN14340.1 ABC transporter permease [Hyunsoonleella pacifica]GGD12923.1 ABC transporter permease [Hyunsoonleella pacifica]
MVKNYIKIAFRNLLRHKSLTFINLLGLATGFAITLLIAQYVQFERSYEQMHPNADRTVRLTLNYLTGNTVTTQDSEMYPAAGSKLVDEVPEVEMYTRVYSIGEPNSPMQVGDQQFLMSKLYAVDPDFFNIFSYDFIYGNKDNLFKKPNEAVITESIALKYFNRIDVVGELLKSPGPNGDILYNIVGVTHDSPPNTHLKVDMLISYPTMFSDPEMLRRHGEKKDNWDGNNSYMYAQLVEGANYTNFTSSLDAFTKRLIAEEKIKSEAIVAQKITDIHLYSKKTFEPEPNGDARSVYFLFAVAVLIIISAFVNYINLTTSQALDRAKEVGVKKVLGSTKSQLRIQFLVESIMLNLLAGGLAVGLVAIVKPKFLALAGLPEHFSLFSNLSFWLLLLVFIVFGGILSGLYPAFVLSSFKPSTILKGNFSHSSKGNLLRKGLVVFQFAITTILLIQTFTVNEQIDFLRALDRGVNVEQSIVVEAPAKNAAQNYSAFKQNLLTNSNVKIVALSHTVPGQPSGALSTTADIRITGTTPDAYHNFYLTFIDKDYVPLLGVEMLTGTNFDEGTTPQKRDVIVNEKALEKWNITNPEEAISKKLSFWGAEWNIKGVVKNYHQQSPKSPILPMIHIFNNYFGSLATVQFSGGSPTENLKQVREAFNTIYPGAPFSYFFMDQEYDKQFKAEDRFKSVFMILTAFSMLIACLGLLGLASFSVAKRKKEIGIRKVVGASTATILILLSKDALKTVLISVIISVPITYLLLQNWLKNFAYRIDLNIWMFILPIFLVFLLVLLSISFKTVKTALMNPVNSLRSE